MTYLLRLGRSLSRVLNTATGGDEHETTSARLGHLMRVYPDHWPNRVPMPRFLRNHFLES